MPALAAEPANRPPAPVVPASVAAATQPARLPLREPAPPSRFSAVRRIFVRKKDKVIVKSVLQTIVAVMNRIIW